MNARARNGVTRDPVVQREKTLRAKVMDLGELSHVKKAITALFAHEKVIIKAVI
jgi:hypothetical protein